MTGQIGKKGPKLHALTRRDGPTCWLCGKVTTVETRTIDHVVPVALGGSNHPANLRVAHWDCNSIRACTMPDADLAARIEVAWKEQDFVEAWRSLGHLPIPFHALPRVKCPRCAAPRGVNNPDPDGLCRPCREANSLVQRNMQRAARRQPLVTLQGKGLPGQQPEAQSRRDRRKAERREQARQRAPAPEPTLEDLAKRGLVTLRHENESKGGT